MDVDGDLGDAGCAYVVAGSGIHGEGVFARRDIRKGEPVLECGGRLVSGDELPPGMRAMQLGDDAYLVEEPGNPRADDYLNHSCEPNIGFLAGDCVLYALREIGSGEELLFDYSTTMGERGWSLPCRCGTPSCRGEIRSFWDLDEADRARLRGIALAYLRVGAGAPTRGG